MSETTHPTEVFVRGGVTYVRNGPLVGPGGPLNQITSRFGPREPINTGQGTTGSLHNGNDIWVWEQAIPGNEAPEVALAPGRVIATIWDPVGRIGIMTVLEHPALSDGRRMFSRILHGDPDLPQTTLLEVAKGDYLQAMGETGLARGEHGHQELIVERWPGLIKYMTDRGASIESIVSRREAFRGPSGILENGVQPVDWLLPEWLDYINSFAWGAAWPAETPVQLSRVDLRNRIVLGAMDAYDQGTNPRQLSAMEELPEPPAGWDHEYRLLTRATG